MRRLNCTVLLAALVLTASVSPQQPSPSSTLTVFVRGAAVGSEEVTLTRSADGWTIVTTGRLGSPFNIITRRLEIRYDTDWKPREMTLDAAIGGQPQRLHTVFQAGSATSEISQGGQTTTKTDPVSADTIALPTPFFGAYEALTARLAGASPPAELRAYLAPQAEVPIRIAPLAEQRIQLAGGPLTARRFEMTIGGAAGQVAAEIWLDDGGRLLRFQIPAQSLDVVRQDIAAVSTRIERLSRPGDELVSIPGNGFSLAATIGRPTGSELPRLPALVLVGGSTGADRDETIAGIPIFGQLAGTLADLGYLVVRYDKRGVGLSGGRLETATVVDYAEDVRWIVRYLADRKDVDERRVAIVGHGEGGTVALSAAHKQDRIKAVVLVATPSIRGAELVLEQQRHALERSTMSQAEKETAIDLQQKIIQAVYDGEGWEGIPPDVRRRVDTPFYRSFLLLDPSESVAQVSQPILVVQGALDKQVLPYHADRLVEMARARKGKNRVSEVASVPGVNHLLVPATTGEVDEYAQLKGASVSPDVAKTIAAWLDKIMPPPPR